MARTAWVDRFYFVDVWGRPLFTTLFAPVALLGFIPARFFALAISVATAWQTYRLACDLRMSRAWLVIPFLLGQQTFFELYSNLFTEPLFAMILVVALRCHISGRIKSGMLVASLLPLARPEGAFVCLFWGLWILILSQRERQTSPCRLKLPEASSDRARTSGNAVNERERGVRAGATGNVVHLPVYRRGVNRFGVTNILARGGGVWWFACLLFNGGSPLFFLYLSAPLVTHIYWHPA